MNKETILRSKKFPNLIIQIFDNNEFGMLGEDRQSEDWNKEDDWFTDNDIYAYEVLKLLKEAEKRGCFKNMEGEEDDENKEEILI
jgi:hypothetical protein